MEALLCSTIGKIYVHTNLTNGKNYSIVWQIVNTGDIFGSDRTLVIDSVYLTIPLLGDCAKWNRRVIATQ